MEVVKEEVIVITCISNLYQKLLKNNSLLKCIQNIQNIMKKEDLNKVATMIGEKAKDLDKKEKTKNLKKTVLVHVTKRNTKTKTERKEEEDHNHLHPMIQMTNKEVFQNSKIKMIEKSTKSIYFIHQTNFISKSHQYLLTLSPIFYQNLLFPIVITDLPLPSNSLNS